MLFLKSLLYNQLSKKILKLFFYIKIIIICSLWVFGCLSLESEWEQLFSGLLDSSKCSGCSQQCCSLNGLILFLIFTSYNPPRIIPPSIGINIIFMFCSFRKSVKLVPFSIATTPSCRRGHYSFPRIAPLYPWLPYIAEC